MSKITIKQIKKQLNHTTYHFLMYVSTKTEQDSSRVRKTELANCRTPRMGPKSTRSWGTKMWCRP